MKKTLITSAIATVLGSTSFGANALVNGDTLTLDTGGPVVTSCILGVIDPVSGNCSFGGATNPALNITAAGGSWFQLGATPTFLTGNDGIILGATQPATANHVGLPTGTETGEGIDKAWGFSSNTGVHQTTSPITEASPGLLDFTGWNVAWGAVPSIPMGGCFLVAGGCDLDGDGIDDLVNTGQATIAVTGNTYVLDYFAKVPVGDASGFGGAGYTLHLEGSVVPIPIPAAVWLFGSGLLGLVGVARRRKLAA